MFEVDITMVYVLLEVALQCSSELFKANRNGEAAMLRRGPNISGNTLLDRKGSDLPVI